MHKHMTVRISTLCLLLKLNQHTELNFHLTSVLHFRKQMRLNSNFVRHFIYALLWPAWWS